MFFSKIYSFRHFVTVSHKEVPDKVPEAMTFRALAQRIQLKILESITRRDMASFDSIFLSCFLSMARKCIASGILSSTRSDPLCSTLRN